MSFVYRGPLAPDSPLFVGRDAELRRIDGWLRDGDAVGLILGGRQNGKTTLMLRARQELSKRYELLFLNLQGATGAGERECTRFVAERIAEQLGRPGAEDGADLLRVLRVVAESTPTRLGLFIDEIGALPDGTARWLAATVRSVFTDRFVVPAFERLAFIIAGGEEMMHLAVRGNSPLRNVGDSMYLGDLTATHVAELLGTSDSPTLMAHAAEVYRATCGHPYFTQLVAEKLAAGGAINNIVDEVVRIEDRNLPHIFHAVRDRGLDCMLRRLAAGERVPFSRSDDIVATLELIGIVRDDAGACRVRTAIHLEAVRRRYGIAAPATQASGPRKVGDGRARFVSGGAQDEYADLPAIDDSGPLQLDACNGVDAGRIALAPGTDASTRASSGPPDRLANAAASGRTSARPLTSAPARGGRVEAMMRWTQADVVVLTAIELEYAAVKRVDAGAVPGSDWIEDKHNGLPIALREFVGREESRLRVAVARAPDMGKGSALTTLQPLMDALRPSCIAMCGVCAGRAGKTSLGDVVVAERLYDYDAGKWTELGFEADVRTYSLPAPWKIAAEQFDPGARFGGEAWWQQRPVPYEWQEAWVLVKLHEGVPRPMDLPESEHRCPQWETVIDRLRKSAYLKVDKLTPRGKQQAAKLAFQYRKFPDLSPGGVSMPFQLHIKPIGSGSTVREDPAVWGFITPHMRTTLALEMEASALADLVRARAHHAPVDALVMKGIMDFANHGRDDHFKDWAARASAECLIAFLREQLRCTAGTAPR